MNIKKYIPNVTFTDLLVVLFIIIVKGSIITWFYIPSGSMLPTLQINDRVIVDMDAYSYRVPMTDHSIYVKGEPERGDVVIFKERHSNVIYVKRVVGIAGDHITVKGRDLFINGVAVQSEFLGFEDGYYRYKQNIDGREFIAQYLGKFDKLNAVIDMQKAGTLHTKDVAVLDYIEKYGRLRSGKWIVPDGEVFAMGDNRDESKDSRFESVGSIPVKYVRGKVDFILANMEPLTVAGVNIPLIPAKVSNWNRSVYTVE